MGATGAVFGFGKSIPNSGTMRHPRHPCNHGFGNAGVLVFFELRSSNQEPTFGWNRVN